MLPDNPSLPCYPLRLTRERIPKNIELGASRAEVDTIGDVAFNHGWVNRGLLAVHAFNQVILYEVLPGGTLAETGRISVLPLLRREPTAESGPWLNLAWSTSGAQLIAASSRLHSDSQRIDEFVIIDVFDNGRNLAVSDYIDACVKPYERGNLTVPLDVMTANGLITPPAPTAVPLPTPGECVCRNVRQRVPAAVISAAVANPGSVDGWMQLLNPGKPPGPDNPYRTCLSLLNPGLDYHPLWNRPTFRVGCP